MPATKVILPAEDLAELLAHLGGIAPKRVRLRPLPGTATEADVLAALDAPRKRLCELIDGVLVEKVMGVDGWTPRIAESQGLESMLRPRGRDRAGPKA